MERGELRLRLLIPKEAEIPQLGDATTQEDVVGFDVPVQDAPGVQVVDGGRRLAHVLEEFAARNPALTLLQAFLQPTSEIAGSKFHGDHQAVVQRPERRYLHEVGMIHGPDHLQRAVFALDFFAIEGAVDDLDGGADFSGGQSLPDLAERAFANFFLQFPTFVHRQDIHALPRTGGFLIAANKRRSRNLLGGSTLKNETFEFLVLPGEPFTVFVERHRLAKAAAKTVVVEHQAERDIDQLGEPARIVQQVDRPAGAVPNFKIRPHQFAQDGGSQRIFRVRKIVGQIDVLLPLPRFLEAVHQIAQPFPLLGSQLESSGRVLHGVSPLRALAVLGRMLLVGMS